jgi:hypothetical protein
MAVLAGIDFFTVEVLTWHGLKTCYVPLRQWSIQMDLSAPLTMPED